MRIGVIYKHYTVDIWTFQVDREAQQSRNSDPGDADGIAGALARALASRAKKLNTGLWLHYVRGEFVGSLRLYSYRNFSIKGARRGGKALGGALIN